MSGITIGFMYHRETGANWLDGGEVGNGYMVGDEVLSLCKAAVVHWTVQIRNLIVDRRVVVNGWGGMAL